MPFNGLHMGLGQISRLSDAVTRMVTAENVYGEKGAGGMAEVSVTPQAQVMKIGQQWDGPSGAALPALAGSHRLRRRLVPARAARVLCGHVLRRDD